MEVHSINILLADDDEDDCFLFREVIDELSIAAIVTIVRNGVQLMRWLIENISQLPEVLFLDLNMPLKNGFDCLAEIKKNKSLKHLPVVIFSTFYEKTIAMELFKNGAHFYIRKPEEFSDLKKTVQKVIDAVVAGIPRPGFEQFSLNKK